MQRARVAGHRASGEGPGVLFVHAHPDDESLFTGGTIARCADGGVRVDVVTATGGELGEIRLPGDGPDGPEEVAALRRGELARALRILGAGGPHLLGYRDSGPGGDGPEGCFWRADLDGAVGRVVAHVRRFRPDTVVTHDAWGVYGHADHRQVHRVTLAAVEAAAVGGLYPEAGEPWRVRTVHLVTLPRSLVLRAVRTLAARGAPPVLGTEDAPLAGWPDDDVHVRVDVRPWLDRKLEALAAHASQFGPGSLLHLVPEDLRAEAFATESYVRRGAGPVAGGPLGDLLDGP